MFKKNKHYLIAFFVFIILSLIFLRLPLGELGSKYNGDIDTLLVSWLWSWEMHIIPIDITETFQANIFAPFQNTLAFTEHMFGSLLFAWPIFLLTQNIITTFHLVLLITFIVSGFGGYLLGYHFSRNKWIAFLCGFIYAFVPYKMHHYYHVNLSGLWLPYVFLYLDKFFQKNSWKNIILLGIFTFLVFLNAMQFVIFLPIVFLMIWLVNFLNKKFIFTKQNIIKIFTTGVVFLLLAIPTIIPYLNIKKDYSFQRGIESVEGLSPDLIDYFISPFVYDYFYEHGHVEWKISPGWTFIAILLIAVIYVFKKKKEDIPKIMPYLLLGVIAFLFSFGYYIQTTRADTWGMLGPWAIFYELFPFFRGIRSVGRNSIFVILTGIIIISIGLKGFVKNKKNRIIIFSIFLLMIWEYSMVKPEYKYAINTKNYEPVYEWVKNNEGDYIYLEIPFGENYLKILYDSNYVFKSIHHFKKIANGYSGYAPEKYRELNNKLMSFDKNDFYAIRDYGVDYVIVHYSAFPPKFKKDLITDIENMNFVEKVYEDERDDYVYRIYDYE